MLKMFKSFLGLDLAPKETKPPKNSNWEHVKNIKKSKRGYFQKNVLKTREMLKMLEVFWVLNPPPTKKRGQDPESFLHFNIFNISPVGSIFGGYALDVLTFPHWEASKNTKGGGKTKKTFNILNIFHISPMGNIFCECAL